jgi:putative transposase
MSRAGNPYDNAAMENWMATYKRECVALAGQTRRLRHPRRGQGRLLDYVETYYDRVRCHSAFGFRSPVDFENQLN